MHICKTVNLCIITSLFFRKTRYQFSCLEKKKFGSCKIIDFDKQYLVNKTRQHFKLKMKKGWVRFTYGVGVLWIGNHEWSLFSAFEFGKRQIFFINFYREKVMYFSWEWKRLFLWVLSNDGTLKPMFLFSKKYTLLRFWKIKK